MPGDPNVSGLVAGPGQSLNQYPTAQTFVAAFRNLVGWIASTCRSPGKNTNIYPK